MEKEEERRRHFMKVIPASALVLHALPSPAQLPSWRVTGSTAQSLPFSSKDPSLCRSYFLAWASPREKSCLYYLHTFSYCSWKDLKGGFTHGRVVCLQGSRTQVVVCWALGWVFLLPWVAELIHRQGALSFGGAHASVLQKSVFLCLRELSEGIDVGSLIALQKHQQSWLLTSAPVFLIFAECFAWTSLLWGHLRWDFC